MQAFGGDGYDSYDVPKRAKGGQTGKKHGLPFPSHGAQLDRMTFIIVHYAEAVCYTADAWLDKNRGYLHPEVAYLLTQSDSQLVTTLFPMSCVDVTKKSTVITAQKTPQPHTARAPLSPPPHPHHPPTPIHLM